MLLVLYMDFKGKNTKRIKINDGRRKGRRARDNQLKRGEVVAHSNQMICRRLKLGGVVAHSN